MRKIYLKEKWEQPEKTEGKLEEYSQRQRKRAVHVSKKKLSVLLKINLRINWKIFFGFDKKWNNWRPEPGNAKDQEQ